MIKQIVERNRAAGIAVVYPPVIPSLGGKLFVTDLGTTEITIFSSIARGDVAPTGTISNALMTSPFGIYSDVPRTLLWVANPTPARILAFPNTGTGVVVPTIDIEGISVGFTSPSDVAIDSAGQIYVADESGVGVFVFAASANGNVAPIQNITFIGSPAIVGIDVDSSGNIYCADKTTNTIWVFAPGATGPAVPIRSINGALTGMDPTESANALGALRLGPDGAIWVVVNGNTGYTQILRFALTANGNVAPLSTLTLQIGGGPSMAAVDGITFDSSGNVVWVQISGSPPSIGFNQQSDTGSTPPEGTISGGSTTLSVPWSVAFVG